MASAAFVSKAVVILLHIYCLLLLPLFVGVKCLVLGLCFVLQYFVSFLVLQASRWGSGCFTFVVF